jgi:hypothetical protein
MTGSWIKDEMLGTDRSKLRCTPAQVGTIARCRALARQSITSSARAQYDALGYPAVSLGENVTPPPWAELTKPLSQCRVGLDRFRRYLQDRSGCVPP